MLTIKSFEFSPIQENTYLLYNEFNECIIIDPGCYFPEEKDTLANYITEHKLIPKQLINTHCHLDHVFGNAFVADQYQLELHIHEGEKKVLDYAPTSGLMYNMPFDNYTGKLHFIKDGDVISLGSDTLSVLFTPGHSPASLSFYCDAQNFIIAGDVLFYRSIGRTDLPGGHHATLIDSIKQKLFTLPPNTMVYSGHGRPTTIGEEIKENPFLQ